MDNGHWTHLLADESNTGSLLLVVFNFDIDDFLWEPIFCYKPVLRIRDVYPRSEFSHPRIQDPGSKRFRIPDRIRIKELSFFFQPKNCFEALGIMIRDPGSRGQKAPDPH
jgi:hypothetical protein